MTGSIKGLANGEVTALLIGECQNSMTNPEVSDSPLARAAHSRGIISKVSYLAGACRENGIPVIFGMLAPRPDYQGLRVNCYLMHNIKKTGRLHEGSVHAEIHPALKVEDGDWVSARCQGISDFWGSELDAILRNLRVETLIVTGVSTNVGVFSNTVGAVERGYNVVIPEDCTAGTPAEHHALMMQNTFPLLASMTTCDELVQVIS